MHPLHDLPSLAGQASIGYASFLTSPISVGYDLTDQTARSDDFLAYFASAGFESLTRIFFSSCDLG